MNRSIRIRRRTNPPLTEVYEGLTAEEWKTLRVANPHYQPGQGEPLIARPPSYYLSRVWLGVVPPEEGEPGYACVLGEVYDQDPRPAERVVRLLDEAIALDPKDFSARERKQYDIPENNLEKPTKKRLAQAVVSLKDIYWPQKVLVPPGRGTDKGERRPSPFTAFMQRIDGLQMYDPGLGPYFFKRWYPFYVGRQRTVDGVTEVDQEDPAYNLFLLDALYEAGKLKVNLADCPLFDRGQYQCARRCVGMVLYEMEQDDLTHQLRTWTFGDGYGEGANEDEELLAEAKDQRQAAGAAWDAWARRAAGERGL